MDNDDSAALARAFATAVEAPDFDVFFRQQYGMTILAMQDDVITPENKAPIVTAVEVLTRILHRNRTPAEIAIDAAKPLIEIEYADLNEDDTYPPPPGFANELLAAAEGVLKHVEMTKRWGIHQRLNTALGNAALRIGVPLRDRKRLNAMADVFEAIIAAWEVNNPKPRN